VPGDASLTWQKRAVSKHESRRLTADVDRTPANKPGVRTERRQRLTFLSKYLVSCGGVDRKIPSKTRTAIKLSEQTRRQRKAVAARNSNISPVAYVGCNQKDPIGSRWRNPKLSTKGSSCAGNPILQNEANQPHRVSGRMASSERNADARSIVTK
jgi:hypothetical protein